MVATTLTDFFSKYRDALNIRSNQNPEDHHSIESLLERDYMWKTVGQLRDALRTGRVLEAMQTELDVLSPIGVEQRLWAAVNDHLEGCEVDLHAAESRAVPNYKILIGVRNKDGAERYADYFVKECLALGEETKILPYSDWGGEDEQWAFFVIDSQSMEIELLGDALMNQYEHRCEEPGMMLYEPYLTILPIKTYHIKSVNHTPTKEEVAALLRALNHETSGKVASVIQCGTEGLKLQDISPSFDYHKKWAVGRSLFQTFEVVWHLACDGTPNSDIGTAYAKTQDGCLDKFRLLFPKFTEKKVVYLPFELFSLAGTCKQSTEIMSVNGRMGAIYCLGNTHERLTHDNLERIVVGLSERMVDTEESIKDIGKRVAKRILHDSNQFDNELYLQLTEFEALSNPKGASLDDIFAKKCEFALCPFDSSSELILCKEGDTITPKPFVAANITSFGWLNVSPSESCERYLLKCCKESLAIVGSDLSITSDSKVYIKRDSDAKDDKLYIVDNGGQQLGPFKIIKRPPLTRIALIQELAREVVEKEIRNERAIRALFFASHMHKSFCTVAQKCAFDVAPAKERLGVEQFVLDKPEVAVAKLSESIVSSLFASPVGCDVPPEVNEEDDSFDTIKSFGEWGQQTYLPALQLGKRRLMEILKKKMSVHTAHPTIKDLAEALKVEPDALVLESAWWREPHPQKDEIGTALTSLITSGDSLSAILSKSVLGIAPGRCFMSAVAEIIVDICLGTNSSKGYGNWTESVTAMLLEFAYLQIKGGRVFVFASDTAPKDVERLLDECGYIDQVLQLGRSKKEFIITMNDEAATAIKEKISQKKCARGSVAYLFEIPSSEPPASEDEMVLISPYNGAFKVPERVRVYEFIVENPKSSTIDDLRKELQSLKFQVYSLAYRYIHHPEKITVILKHTSYDEEKIPINTKLGVIIGTRIDWDCLSSGVEQENDLSIEYFHRYFTDLRKHKADQSVEYFECQKNDPIVNGCVWKTDLYDYFKDSAQDIAKGKHKGNPLNIAVMAHTMSCIKLRRIHTNDGAKIEINPSKLATYKITIKDFPVHPPKYKTTEVRVIASDSIDAALELCQDGKTAVLNFANEHRVGGGYKEGANAQEESLFRRCTLGLSLDGRSFGSCSGENHYPLGDFEGVYSEGVQVLREGPEKGFGGLGTEKYIDVITVAAYDLRDISGTRTVTGTHPARYDKDIKRVVGCCSDHTKEFTADYLEKTTKKLWIVFAAAAKRNVEHLVLGAWGCGVFKNPEGDVARIFRGLIDIFAGYFQTVEFAILDKPGAAKGPHKAFSQILTNGSTRYYSKNDWEHPAIKGFDTIPTLCPYQTADDETCPYLRDGSDPPHCFLFSHIKKDSGKKEKKEEKSADKGSKKGGDDKKDSSDKGPKEKDGKDTGKKFLGLGFSFSDGGSKTDAKGSSSSSSSSHSGKQHAGDSHVTDAHRRSSGGWKDVCHYGSSCKAKDDESHMKSFVHIWEKPDDEAPEGYVTIKAEKCTEKICTNLGDFEHRFKFSHSGLNAYRIKCPHKECKLMDNGQHRRNFLHEKTRYQYNDAEQKMRIKPE